MNRKNLTAAVLAGLAGVAGLAGTAQAVNLNPDGLGQVLMYPYYTTNDGNQTLLSVVNTTEHAKAVKVRFLEGFNSREVLDFNLYMSREDVWTAGLIDGSYMGIGEAGTPYLVTQDMSCTVPYLYEMGPQPFKDIAYNNNGTIYGKSYDLEDGGPTSIGRAAEGHFEMIEMGTIEPGSATEEDITHVEFKPGKDDDFEAYWAPGDCEQLVKNWTRKADYSPEGMWTCELDSDNVPDNICDASRKHIDRNSGGLFGGAAIVNEENGTMYSYNAQAIQGFDKSDGDLHYEPGTIHPSLDDGDQNTAWVFFGVPQNIAVPLNYSRTVDAVSALFMHENVMNEFTVESIAAASTEWVVTFPTKNWYVDEEIVYAAGSFLRYWEPDPEDFLGCNGWDVGDDNPLLEEPFKSECSDFSNAQPGGVGVDPNDCKDIDGWDYQNCDFIYTDVTGAIPPFTELFDGKACEYAELSVWDREEIPFNPGGPSGDRPPVVSPSLPGPCDPEIQTCTETPFQLCYEVNVMRFSNDAPVENPIEDGSGVIFGTPSFGDDGSLLLNVNLYDEAEDYTAWDRGWARINLYADSDHEDEKGLVGLPTSGFAAYEFENNFVSDGEGGNVKAYYGGLYGLKGNVRRIDTSTSGRRQRD